MKSDSRLRGLNLFQVVTWGVAGLVCFMNPGLALTEGNPYGAISGRNVFALKPPTVPPPVNTQPVTPPAGIELQGFTTILGRPQVLLKVKVPPKPPEPAKDRSLVMDAGQREGEVEVIEMDAYAGTVQLKNQGNLVSLNLKDNAAKPVAGPALPLPAPFAPSVQPAASGRIGIPAPTGPGGTLPTRAIRTDNSGAPAASGGTSSGVSSPGSATPEAIMRRTEANVALYEVNRLKNEELIKGGARIPRMPMHNLLKQSAPSENSQP